jgi:O-succinylbenzoate synthase
LYELIPRTTLGSIASPAPRRGALLRVQFEDGSLGYADCHPWLELGDLSLDQQLELLREKRLTSLTRRSLDYARIDAKARQSRVSLWDIVSTIPLNHGLIVDSRQLTRMTLETLSKEGFTYFKVKVGGANSLEMARLLRDLAPDLKRLSLQARLDFNTTSSVEQMNVFLEELDAARSHIDFIEDPLPYEPQDWALIQQRWGVRLALDRVSEEMLPALRQGSFSVLIHKPAIQDPNRIHKLAESMDASIVVTSYLDHPFGQYCAAWTAAQLRKNHAKRVEVCGLLSHVAYEPTNIKDWIASKGPEFLKPLGYGFGLDEVLNKQTWISV